MQLAKLKNWPKPARALLKARAGIAPIGMDFGLERLNMVQFERRGDSRNIVAAASVPYMRSRDELLNSPEELRFFINRALKSHPFRGRDVVAALPPSMLQLVHVNYRVGSNEEQSSALVRAVKDRFSDRLENAVIDYLPIRPKVEDQVERTAMVAMSEHSTIVRFLEALRASRLKVRSLEVGSVAIKRLLCNLQEGEYSQRKVMAINFATSKCFATVLWGGELLLDREVAVGVDCLLSAITETLDLSADKAQQMLETHGLPAEDVVPSLTGNTQFTDDLSATFANILKPGFIKLASDIRKVLIYTAAETQGGAIDTVYLLGNVARWPGADQYLSRLINLPVVTIDPLFGYDRKKVDMGKRKLEPISGIAVATGLALRDESPDA